MSWKIALMVFVTVFGTAACTSTDGRHERTPDSLSFTRHAYVADRFDNKVTVFRPKDATGPVPWLFMVPGGGWRTVSPPDKRLANELSRNGIAVVAASYRTRYKAKWPAQLDDVEAAFDYARSHAAELGLKPDAYAITGGSAGSTEAAWLSIRESPACTVLMSSPLNFTTFRNDAIRDVLGGYDPRSASPVFAVRGGMAPTVLIHGTHDPIVPFYQSEQYEKALQKAGNSVQLWPYDGGHGNMPPALQERQKTFILSCLGVS